MSAKALGELILKARKDKGMNQRDVAAALGVKQQSVSRWETGSTETTRLRDVVDLLGIDLTDALRARGLLRPGERVVS